ELTLDDPRRKPFRELLLDVHRRYDRPIVVAETSARGAFRPVWLRYVVDECLAALAEGVDVQGICLFPMVDMPEWKHGQLGEWGQLGLTDVRTDAATVHRVPYAPYSKAVAEAQARLASSGR